MLFIRRTVVCNLRPIVHFSRALLASNGNQKSDVIANNKQDRFNNNKNNNVIVNRFNNNTIRDKINSGETQFESARMADLKTIHLRDISKKTFELFNTHVQTDEVQFLNNLFKNHGLEIRLAGGGVRDLLCHIAPHDIDFATPATPTKMIEILENIENVRLITTASGLRHGTVTARINNRNQFEITTLRIDKETDGRHAQVEFVNDWKIDASRRDLTINSMFIDLDGVLYDYFNGKEDLDHKRIRFVGDVGKRIREDYLRIFRYFRFHARFGIPGVHDQETIETMRNGLPGLEIISGERIWSEMKRILSNTKCVNAIEVLFGQMDTAQWLGFQHERLSLERFYKTVENLNNVEKYSLSYPWSPHVLFASLVENVEELSGISTRLRFSNIERDCIVYIISNRDTPPELITEKALKTQLAMAPKPDQPNLRDFVLQFLFYVGADVELIKAIHDWQIPEFPFKGNMVAKRVKRKQQISQLIGQLKKEWANRDFAMTEEEMQVKVNEILEQFQKSAS